MHCTAEVQSYMTVFAASTFHDDITAGLLLLLSLVRMHTPACSSPPSASAQLENCSIQLISKYYDTSMTMTLL